MSLGHACVDVYQGAVAALVPFFVAERAYSYAAASGVVLAASLLSSVVQPLFGALTDRRPMPWLLPLSALTDVQRDERAQADEHDRAAHDGARQP